MNTDNKQTQEYRVTGSEAFYYVDSNDKVIAECYGIEAKERAEFIAEAFNTKALTGKGPKELWEENKAVYLENTKLKLANKQLSEKVKELEKDIQNIHDATNPKASSNQSHQDLKTLASLVHNFSAKALNK